MNNKFQTYQSLAMRTAKPMNVQDDLLHAALGLTGEAGEFADCIKKHWAYNQPLDSQNAIEELGDLLWYIALASNALGVSMDEVAAINLEKLRKRYPAKYQDELAQIRADKQLEIGAGGVSGPLIGRAALQSPSFDAADMATAAAQGFRDGVASVAANAGSEPIAWLVCTEEGDPSMVFLDQREAQMFLEDDERPTPLYTHPPTPTPLPHQPRGWSMGERSNPNNCASCRHKQNPDGGHCYMFRFEPTEMCAQHTSQIHALQALRM